MVTKEPAKHPRVAEIEEEISQALARGLDDKKATAVLGVLDELRKEGVTRSQYNLGSPYGQGLSHCETGAEEE